VTVDPSELVDTLNELIETCRDGEKGFREAAEGVEDPDLSRLFLSYAAQRAQFASELEEQVRQLGGVAARRGHLAGAAHRGWMHLRSAVSCHDEGTALAEAERGEDHAARAYGKALDTDLPREVRALVGRQYAQVREAHDRVRSLERRPERT
jgi:uncharacterized protein (TIGR02284 family)